MSVLTSRRASLRFVRTRSVRGERGRVVVVIKDTQGVADSLVKSSRSQSQSAADFGGAAPRSRAQQRSTRARAMTSTASPDVNNWVIPKLGFCCYLAIIFSLIHGFAHSVRRCESLRSLHLAAPSSQILTTISRPLPHLPALNQVPRETTISSNHPTSRIRTVHSLRRPRRYRHHPCQRSRELPALRTRATGCRRPGNSAVPTLRRS